MPTQPIDRSDGSLSVDPARSVTTTTEITVLGGYRYQVEGDAREVERLILDAARGSLMELAWLVEADTGERIGVNPDCVVMLRAVGS
jgi:hypothetical protein